MTQLEAKSMAFKPCLIPLNIQSAREADLLVAQRKICGWGEQSIPPWTAAILAGEREMFWICIPASTPDAPSGLAPLPSDPSYLAAGHVALDKADIPAPYIVYEGDKGLARPDGSVMTIAALFVMPAVKALGLGTFAMLECEIMARRPPYGNPACEAVTINTLSPRHTLQGGVPGDEGMGVWPRMGMEMPQRSNMGWFAKMGYAQYDEGPRYKSATLDGGFIDLWCVYMRKELPKGA